MRWLAILTAKVRRLVSSSGAILVGLSGVEPLTSCLSGTRSNQLSYRPSGSGRLHQRQSFYHNHEERSSEWTTADVDLDVPICFAYCDHTVLLRKEVIQPQLPLRLPCYDLAPVIGITLDAALLAVRQTASGAPNFRGLTGGVYKARERIHRCLLISDY